jgi:hypothetical protein
LESSLCTHDIDGDGYGDEFAASPLDAGTDCDDSDAFFESADADNDGYSTCDGDCDDSDATLNNDDADGDGYSTCDGDCDDTDSSVVDEWHNPACSTWAAVATWAHPGTMTGYGTSNGAMGGQSASTVSGKSCLLQYSDWNHFYGPTSSGQRSSTGIEAVSVDVYVPNQSYAYFRPNASGGHYSYPGVVVMGMDRGSNKISIQSTLTNVSYSTSTWMNLWVATNSSTGELAVYVDGSLVDTSTFSGSLSNSYIHFNGGSTSWTAANVCWANVAVYEQ